MREIEAVAICDRVYVDETGCDVMIACNAHTVGVCAVSRVLTGVWVMPANAFGSLRRGSRDQNRTAAWSLL